MSRVSRAGESGDWGAPLGLTACSIDRMKCLSVKCAEGLIVDPERRRPGLNAEAEQLSAEALDLNCYMAMN